MGRGTGSTCVSGTRRGACPLCRLPPPAFSFDSAPYPPSPLPGGKGEIFSFLMQGASPLASPRLNPRGTGLTCRCGVRRGACLSPRPPTPPLALFLPPSPRPPSPPGKGERGDRGQESKLKAGGNRRQSRHAPRRVQRRQGQAGDQPGKPPPGTAEEGSVSAASGSVQGCRGRSPRRNKLWGAPFPAGEGGGGIGGRKAS